MKSGELERIWFQKGPRGMDRLLCRLGSGTGQSQETRHAELVGWAGEKAGSGGRCRGMLACDPRPAIPAERIYHVFSFCGL